MRSLFAFSLLTTLVASAQIVHEERGLYELSQPQARSRVNPNAVVPVRIGLVQRNLDRGYDHLMSVSHPDSKTYGQHWTDEQIEAEFSPSVESVEAVRQWLAENGVHDAEMTGKGWMAFDAPIDVVEQLLDAKFYEYRTDSDDQVTVGCDRYSLPEHIATHVDYITPGVKQSPRMAKRTIKRSAPTVSSLLQVLNRPGQTELDPEANDAPSQGVAHCSSGITPPCLRALYNISHPPSDGFVTEGIMGVYENGNTYAQKDLDLFFAKYAPYVPNGTHPNLVSLFNATAPSPLKDASGEADIDFAIAYAVLGNSNITLYQTQNPATGNPPVAFSDVLDAVDGSFCTAQDRKKGYKCGGDSLTTVVSASYSTSELFYQSYKAQQRVCAEFMKLSLKGHTFVFSSGDYGVASNPLFGDELCINNGCIPQDLNMTVYGSDYNGTIFSPGFPSNCPYVLAVGATMMRNDSTVQDPEVGMDVPDVGMASCDHLVNFTSSGGFANYFPRPSYQDAAVGAYLKSHAPNYKYYAANAVDVTSSNTTIGKNGGIYNRGGRGIPDVSANGAYYHYFNLGKAMFVDGTSLSTPLWASLIAMINQARANAGKTPVGFVNPVLYQHPEVFHDIVEGSNPGCGTPGFSAVKGWDPVTGLGTPNYPALLELFMSMP